MDPALAQRLERIERRLDALERPLTVPREGADASAEVPQLAIPAIGTSELAPLLGRTLVVIGGAFVLRAVTEAGLLSPALGAALAIVYAVAWFVLADRAAGKGHNNSAVWHAIAGTIIAFPLLLETAVKFRFLTPTAAAATLGLITAIGLGVGWRRRSFAIASIVTVAAAGTLLALGIGTKLPVMFAGWMLLVGLATLWIGYSRDWPGIAWLAALPADFTVAVLAVGVLVADSDRVAERFRPGAVVALLLALVVLYVGSFVIRTLVARAEVRTLEITQGLFAVAIGLGGAIMVARRLSWAWVPLGLVATVLGVAGYAASFTLIDRSARRANFIFYSSLAMVFTLVGVTALLPQDVLVIVLALGALLMAWSGARLGRATLNVHGAVYAAAAALASGLLTHSADTLTARVLTTGDWVGPAVLIALGGTIGYCAFEVPAHGRTWGQLSTIPKFAVLTIAFVGLGGVAVAVISGVLPQQDGAVVPSALAILRTAVLAVAAVALASLGRYARLMQATWLVYPVLAGGGIKLLIEDLRVAGPAMLVASFALYGGALILAPRLTRKASRGTISGP